MCSSSSNQHFIQAYSPLAYVIASPLFMMPIMALFYFVFIVITCCLSGMYEQV